MGLARTRSFQPSRLALVARCALRYLLETETPIVAQISPTLPTLFGRSVHEIIDRGLGSSSDVRSALVEQVNDALRAIDAPVPRWAAKHDLLAATMVAPTMLADWVRFAVLRLGSASMPRSLGSGRPKFGGEIRLDSELLDLAGRADRIDDAHSASVVTEFKTGRLRLDPGDDHRVQLLAYGLLVADRDRRPVELNAVTPVEQRSIPFDAGAMAEITGVLSAAQARLPRDTALDPATLAAPGPACRGCRFRPSCPTYPAWAERAWRDAPTSTPLDLWGEVSRVHRRGELLDLIVASPDDALARVVGLPCEDPDYAPRLGERIRLFELVSAEVARGSRRPANFVVANQVRPAGSAWSAWVDRSDGVGVRR